MPDSPWPTIHAERAALSGDCSDLTAKQWATPSLCSDWSVHQVLAHLLATAGMTPLRFFTQFARAKFSFGAFSERQVAALSAAGPDTTLRQFRQVEKATTAPPGPRDSWLGEILVHAEDIRRPLGIRHDYPPAWVARATEFYAGSNALIGGKDRVKGLTLTALDHEWSYGTGPVVLGPAMSLLLATCGRRVALHDLSGPGLDTLRGR